MIRPWWLPWLCSVLAACGDDGRCREAMQRVQATEVALCKALLAEDLAAVRERAAEIVGLLASDAVREHRSEAAFAERRSACEEVVGQLASASTLPAAQHAYRQVTAACEGCHERYRPR